MAGDNFILPLFPIALGVYNLGEEMHELNHRLLDDVFREKERDPNVQLRSLNGGWQSEDDLRNRYESFDELCKIVEKQSGHYLSRIGSSPDIKVPDCWINLSEKGGYNYPHNHNGNVLTGVYYPVQKIVDGERIFNYGSGNPITPNYHGGEGGELYIQSPIYMGKGWTDDVETTAYNIGHYSTYPVSGYLFIFPGYIIHGVNPIQTDCTRISIAFQYKYY